MRIASQLADDESSGEVIDLSWPRDTVWDQVTREQQQLSDASDRLAAHAERLLGQADATGVLAGVGFALLALRLELRAEDTMRDYRLNQ